MKDALRTLAASLLLLAQPVSAQLDDSCVVTANGQIVNVGPTGSFTIFNVPADGEWIRVEAICINDGKTTYARSNLFKLAQNQTVFIHDFEIFSAPPADLVSLTATPGMELLTSQGIPGATSIIVTGSFSDGSQVDLSYGPGGTTYTSSDPGVAIVDEVGAVIPVANGTTLITARNSGITATTAVTVSLGDPLTEVIGLVQLPDGSPAEGASVQVDVGGSASTGANGFFSIPGVASELGDLLVSVSLVTGEDNLVALASGIEPVADGVTDAGVLTLVPIACVFDLDVGTPLQQGDDDFDFVAFGSSKVFPFFGNDYGGVWINSNGNLTFDSGDSEFAANSAYIVSVPRIAPAFFDLDPDDGGDVYYNQFEDRFVVTWLDIPQYGAGGSHRIQASLHFDGRVHFSYDGLSEDGSTEWWDNGISVAMSPGNDPGIEFIDISSAGGGVAGALDSAIYELFTAASPFDLDFACVDWVPTGDGSYSVSLVPAIGEQGTGDIAGTVMDAEGRLVAGALVTARSIPQTRLVHMVRTGLNGQFSIPGIRAPDTLRLEVLHAGVSAGSTISVRAGTSLEDVVLRPQRTGGSFSKH